MKRYITDEVFENILDEYKKCFGIRYHNGVITKEGKMIGQILFGSSVTKKTLKFGDHVEFSSKMIKYRSFDYDEDGFGLCVVHQKFVKPLVDTQEQPFKTKILKSNINTDTGIREYYIAFEDIKFTYKQYLTRRLLLDFGNYEHRFMAAYDNFNERLKVHSDYYRALNETCKHYLVEHDLLKKFISEVNHAKKKYKNEWTENLNRYIINDELQRVISKMVKVEEVNKDNVVDFRK